MPQRQPLDVRISRYVKRFVICVVVLAVPIVLLIALMRAAANSDMPSTFP